MIATVQLLTRAELAALLRIAPRTLSRRLAAGDMLEPLGGLGHPRWNADEVNAWIRAGRPRSEHWQVLKNKKR